MTDLFPRELRRLALPALLLAAGNGFAADSIESVGKTAGEWVRIRAETVRIENEWLTERALLESTVNSLKERAIALEEKRDHARAARAEERAELATLAAKGSAAAQELSGVENRLQTVTAGLLALRPTLPPRLSEALEMSFRSLRGSGLSPGERMQLVMTVLNRCAQFNGMVSAGEEVLTLAGEPGPKSVDVIYWGLSHGYAFDRTTGRAWLGRPGADQWEWQARPEAAAAVGELMAIHRDKADPGFVAVPAHLRNTAAGTPTH